MLLKKFWEYIEKSLTSGISKKISTTRISSYLILGSILTTTLIYLIIDVINAIIMWVNKENYIIPGEHLVFFGMVLTHHLALLGINKNAETKQNLDNIKSIINKEEEIVDTTKKTKVKKNQKTNESTTNEEDLDSDGMFVEETI